MTRIKVARIVTGLWRGGVEKKLVALLPKIDRSKFDVSVICIREAGALADDLREQGIPVHVCPVKTRWSPSGLTRLKNLIKKEGFDVVHTHMYRSNTSGTVAAKWAGVPVIISHIHNVNTWDKWSQLLTDRFLARFKSKTIFVSGAVRDNFLAKVTLPDDRHTVIYNGVDTKVFCPGDDNPMNLPGTVRIGAATRLMPQKGLDRLFAILKDPDLADTDLRIYILGDGPLRGELETMIRDNGVSDRFTILGFQDDVVSFLRSIHVFTMPSLKEGFSNALIEAMAVGVPPVATAVGGNPEAVRDGQDGFIVPLDDKGLFTDRVKTLVLDENLRHRMRTSAIERADKFSITRMLDRTTELYESLL